MSFTTGVAPADMKLIPCGCGSSVCTKVWIDGLTSRGPVMEREDAELVAQALARPTTHDDFACPYYVAATARQPAAIAKTIAMLRADNEQLLAALDDLSERVRKVRCENTQHHDCKFPGNTDCRWRIYEG